MTEIIIIIIAVYLFYYAVNIIYDLFLKKDNSLKQDDTEEYSLTEFAEKDKNEIKGVGIDDVENINTPESFNKRDLFPTKEAEQDQDRDLDHWRNKFESEQDIDTFEDIPDRREQPYHQKENSIPDKIEIDQDAVNKDRAPTKIISYQEQFHQFLSLAETSVQVISDHDGYKIYQSVI